MTNETFLELLITAGKRLIWNKNRIAGEYGESEVMQSLKTLALELCIFQYKWITGHYEKATHRIPKDAEELKQIIAQFEKIDMETIEPILRCFTKLDTVWTQEVDHAVMQVRTTKVKLPNDVMVTLNNIDEIWNIRKTPEKYRLVGFSEITALVEKQGRAFETIMEFYNKTLRR